MIVKIIDSYQVTAKVDGKNIIKFNSPRNVIDQTSTYYKGFQIANNIWVVPQRYKRDEINIKENGGVYDSTYLTSQEEQQAFLDDIVLLFKRINNTEYGESFLSLLTAAVPFPAEDRQKYYGTNYLLDVDTISLVGMNLIIYGPDSNLMDFKTMPLNIHDAENGTGTAVEICFTPHLTFQFEGIIQDPVLSLWQQLIYTMHMLYGIKIPEKYTIPYEAIHAEAPLTYLEMPCEDILVAGGQDYRYATKLPQWPGEYFQQSIDLINKKIPLIESTIKSKIHDEKNNPTGTIPKQFYDCLQKKYGIDIKTIWNITVDKCAAYLGLAFPPQPFFQNDYGFSSSYYELNFKDDYTQQGLKYGQSAQCYTKTPRQIYRKPSITSCYSYKDKDSSKEYCVELYNANFEKNSTDCYKQMKIDSVIHNTDDELLLMESSIDEINSIKSIKGKGIDLIDEIDEIQPLIFDMPYSMKVSKVEKTISSEITPVITHSNKPLPEHYLKAQTVHIEPISPDNTNRKLITLTNSLVESIQNRNKHYAYSPFLNFSKALVFPKNKQLESEFGFYTWLQQIAKNFKNDVEEIQLTNEIKGVPFIVSWINPGLEILNNNQESELPTYNLNKLIETLIHKPMPPLIFPAIKSLELENLKTNTDTSSDTIIDNILKLRKSQWRKMYDIITHQWWTTYDLPFRKIIYQVRESLYYQIQIAINNCYYYLHATTDTLKMDNQTQNNIKKAIDELKERLNRSAQNALENVSEFIFNCSIAYFKNELLPEVLTRLKSIDEQSREKLNTFRNTLNGELLKQFNRNINIEFPFEITGLPKIKDLIQSQVFYNKPNSIFHLNIPDDSVETISDSSINSIEISATGDIKIISGRTDNAIKIVAESPGTIQVPIQGKMDGGILTDFTMVLWVKIASDGILSTKIITNTHNGDIGYSLWLNYCNLVWSLGDSNNTKINMKISNVVDDRWHHIAFVHDRLGNLIVYVDGIFYGSKDISNLGNIHTDTPMKVRVDNEENQGEKTYVIIENLDIYRKALNSKEIQSLYANSFVDEFLRDWSGEVVTTDKEYILVNIAYPKKKMELNPELFAILKVYEDKQQLGQPTHIKLSNDLSTDNKKIKNNDLISINIPDIDKGYFDIDSSGKKIIIREEINENDAVRFQIINNRTLGESGLFKLATVSNNQQSFIGLLDYFVDNGTFYLSITKISKKYNQWKNNVDNRIWALVAIEDKEI